MQLNCFEKWGKYFLITCTAYTYHTIITAKPIFAVTITVQMFAQHRVFLIIKI